MDLSHHHAYLISGRVGDDHPDAFIRKNGVILPPDARVIYRIYDTFGIDDARELFDLQLRKTAEGAVSVFLLETSLMTREAQSALLKMLEDPSPRTHFFLVTPHPELLLSTLRSRFAALEGEKAGDLTAAISFLAASYAERAAVARELVENASRSAAEGLVRGIVVLLHQRGADPDLLSRIERLRRYSTDPASSLKMILDCCMYSIPA